MSTMDHIGNAIEAATPDLIELRRDLHAHPELSWNEERTTDVVATWMDKLDIAYRRLDGSGLVGEVGPANAPVVALRADLDALPVHETAEVAFPSTAPGVAHACAHDIPAAPPGGA